MVNLELVTLNHPSPYEGKRLRREPNALRLLG